jgi:hypothetical protein
MNNEKIKKQAVAGTVMKRITTMIFALALIGQVANAQTITSTGSGIAGTSATYNIGIVASTASDDISSGVIHISINGHLWPIYAPSPYSSAYCRVAKWDAVKGKYVNYGFIKARTEDGTAFLGGQIFIRMKPTLRVVMFKAIPFYTPAIGMPTLVVSYDVGVMVYSPALGLFIRHRELDILTNFVSGMMWLNSDGSLHSAVLDGQVNNSTLSNGLNIIPAPSGPNLPIMPAKRF